MDSVYIFGSSETGPLKIGFSVHPEGRLAALQGGHPYKLKIMRTWQHPQAYAIETATKRALRPLQTYGEWFSIGIQAAILAVENAVAAVEAMPVRRQPRADRRPMPRPVTSLAAAQQERADQIEAVEAEAGCRLSRQEITNMELSGFFGERWAAIRRSQVVR